jgi:large subunit ribosomal protein L21
MFAVIETGGKQYRVREGDVIEVELEAGGDSAGSREVEFDRVLMVGGGETVQIGQPTLEGARVTASLVRQMRGPKVKVFKKKRRKGYKRLNGHRQDLLQVRIGAIGA